MLHNYGGQEYILNAPRRKGDFVSQNREGLFSLAGIRSFHILFSAVLRDVFHSFIGSPGYCAIFHLGAALGSVLLRCDGVSASKSCSCVLIDVSALSWMAFFLLGGDAATSRRMVPQSLVSGA